MGDSAFIKTTQDTLGKIIRKPPLTEKLLKKPPFRFLHDIITEVIRTTGFFKGLYNETELDSKNVTSREDKIQFLQKAFDCISVAAGISVAAKPTKIVAGHEPEKTNEFLQTIAKCIRKNVSSQSNGKKKSSHKPDGKENRESDSVKKEKSSKERHSEKNEQSSNHGRSKNRSERHHRNEDKNEERGAGEGSEDRNRSSRRSSEQKESRKKEERESSGKRRRHRNRAEEEEQQAEAGEAEQAEESPTNEKTSSRPPRPASAKGHRRRPVEDKSKSPPEQPDEPEKPSKDNKTSGRPARPPSARPAAPKVQQRKTAAEDDIARIESAGRTRKAPLIVDDDSAEQSSSSDDEDKQFLVQEESIQPPKMDKLSPTPGDLVVNGEDEDEHGILVRKILETKKDIEQSAAKGHKGRKHTEIDRAPMNEAQYRKERELVQKSIENLRASVQKLCRSAAPLGKMIDYIQEDMDAMNNEINQWRKDNDELDKHLKEEESITQKTIEPLKVELEELELAVVSQMDMIATAKCNVLRNQEKIDKMIAGVTTRT